MGTAGMDRTAGMGRTAGMDRTGGIGTTGRNGQDGPEWAGRGSGSAAHPSCLSRSRLQVSSLIIVIIGRRSFELVAGSMPIGYQGAVHVRARSRGGDESLSFRLAPAVVDSIAAGPEATAIVQDRMAGAL